MSDIRTDEWIEIVPSPMYCVLCGERVGGISFLYEKLHGRQLCRKHFVEEVRRHCEETHKEATP